MKIRFADRLWGRDCLQRFAEMSMSKSRSLPWSSREMDVSHGLQLSRSGPMGGDEFAMGSRYLEHSSLRLKRREGRERKFADEYHLDK